MRYPRVAVIILNFNGITDTRQCLKSLVKTSYPNFRVIVADNGSTINEALILSNQVKDSRISYLRFNKNFGFTGGNNRVLRRIKEKYVVLLNNDTTVRPSWLTNLVKVMEKNNNIGVAQPKILWERDKKYFDYAGASGGFIDILGYPFTRGRIFNFLEQDRGQYDYLTDIFWASGAAVIMRTSVLEEVGTFDESFFNYMEEIDLCYRVHQAGYKIVCEPKSVIYHKVAGTAGRNYLKKRFWEHRNNLLFILKNYPVSKLIYIFPVRILFEYISIIFYILLGKPQYILSVLASQIDLIRMAPGILKKRRFNRSQSKELDKLVYNGSIVVAHFILGRRKFSELINRDDYLRKISL